MAKKRKKDKEEKQEYEFTPPEFNEKEFLLKELKDTKTVIITVGYAAVFGIVAGVLASINELLSWVGLGLLFGGIFSLKYVYPRLKIDTSTFVRKNWAGNVFWFFMTFLAVWILVLNFPFADHADPSVTDITVWVQRGTNSTAPDYNLTAINYEYVDSAGSYMWVPQWGGTLESVLYASALYTVNITAKVADNGRLATVRVSVDGGDFATMSPEGDHRFGFSVTGDQISSSSLSFTIVATDSVGHEKIFTPASGIPVSG